MPVDKSLLKRILSECEDGDILLCRGPWFSFRIGSFRWTYYPDIWAKGMYTHAGLFDKKRYLSGNEYCILSASDHVYGFKRTIRFFWGMVGYESITAWAKEDYITIFRVKNHTREAGSKCIDFLQPFMGSPFFISGIGRTNTHYCSKLIVIAWNSQGVDFDVRNFKLMSFFKLPVKYCTPNFIAKSCSVVKIFEL